MTSTLPSVAMIVLNFNKRTEVLDAIDTALASEYPHLHILVVDNASTDGSWETISKTYPGLTKIRLPTNLGAAGGRNAGWKHLKKQVQVEYLLFLDDDAVIAHNAISNFVHALRSDQTVGIACGKGYTRPPSTTINSVGIRVNLYTGIIHDIGAGERDRGQYDSPRYVSACGCFGLFIRTELFEQLDGFDERFNPYGWEDVDLCLRAKRLGMKTLYVPQAIVYHKGTQMGRKPLPHYEQTKARNYLYLVKEHANISQLICIGLFLPFRFLTLITKLIRQGNGTIMTSHAKGVWQAIGSSKNPHVTKGKMT